MTKSKHSKFVQKETWYSKIYLYQICPQLSQGELSLWHKNEKFKFNSYVEDELNLSTL